MKRTSAELKRMAREHLTGHWGLAIGTYMLLGLITSAVMMPFYFIFILSGMEASATIIYCLAVLIITAVATVMQAGLLKIYLGFARKKECRVGMLFGEFVNRPDRYILAFLMLLGIELVCMAPGLIFVIVASVSYAMLFLMIAMILYIAGAVVMVILSLQFAMVYILLVDNPGMGAMDAFRESARLMNGNKGRLFYIQLSFIGWSILGMLSCGIGMLWVYPYMIQTNVSFYRELTGELDEKQDDIENFNNNSNHMDYSDNTNNNTFGDYTV